MAKVVFCNFFNFQWKKLIRNDFKLIQGRNSLINFHLAHLKVHIDILFFTKLLSFKKTSINMPFIPNIKSFLRAFSFITMRICRFYIPYVFDANKIII